MADTLGDARDAVAASEPDILRTAEAGPKVIRGGVLRFAGYGGGLLFGAAASVFLLRHLGVRDFGHYVTVMALIAIVSGVTDAGLTVIGSRELALRERGEPRRRLVASIVAIRLVLTPVGVLLATAFAAVAGYGTRMTAGVLIAGVGVVLLNVQSSMMLPLTVELKNGRASVAELLKHFVNVVGIATLAVAGATLLPFFAVQILVGVALLAATPVLVGRGGVVRPRFDRADWKLLAIEATPVAAAFVLGILYFRLLMIMVSLIGSAHETGLFGASFRILEVLAGMPVLLAGVVLPVAAAARENPVRLRYVLQRVTEAALLGGVVLSIVSAIAARPVIRLLGGAQYLGAVPMFRVQAFALVGIFLSQAFTIGLVVERRQRAIAIATAVGLASVFVLGLAVIPPFHGVGAAAAGVAADALLALLTYVFLRRAGVGRSLDFRFTWKVIVAALLAGAVAFVPGVPPLVLAVIAGLVYVAVAFALGAVPVELVAAFPLRRGLARRA